MTAHIHAELMAKYAADAMETDKPWERWEFCGPLTNGWMPLPEHSQTFHKCTQYRRKPQKKIMRAWVNLYKNSAGSSWPTKEEADKNGNYILNSHE